MAFPISFMIQNNIDFGPLRRGQINNKVRSVPHYHLRQTDFLDRMDRIGWHPESVNAVLCTHLHADHVGWNTVFRNGHWKPTFPNARYYFARGEYENTLAELAQIPEGNVAQPDISRILEDSVTPVVRAGLAVLVEPDTVLTPEVRLVPSPGHTPSHVSVIIESCGERAIVTGDMMHHPCQVSMPHWSPRFDWNPEISKATRIAFLREYSDSKTLVIGSHFPAPTAGFVVSSDAGYRFL